MRRCTLPCLIVLLALIPNAVIASVTLPVGARAAFLRLDPTDTADSPLIVTLASFGMFPGSVLRLTALGDFDNGPGGDIYHSFFAVFSGSPALLDGTQPHRVPDAIDAGIYANSGTTCPSGVPNDIPEDFVVPPAGVDVTIPDGATHLFVETADCLFFDNSDPDGDYAIRLELVTTGVADRLGSGLALLAPWPNPVQSRVTLPFSLPAAGQATLAVYGVDGRRVRTLFQGERGAGRHELVWDAADHRGNRVPAGLYFARLATERETVQRKVVVSR
jgi:hypothetical protein